MGIFFLIPLFQVCLSVMIDNQLNGWADDLNKWNWGHLNFQYQFWICEYPETIYICFFGRKERVESFPEQDKLYLDEHVYVRICGQLWRTSLSIAIIPQYHLLIQDGEKSLSSYLSYIAKRSPLKIWKLLKRPRKPTDLHMISHRAIRTGIF